MPVVKAVGELQHRWQAAYLDLLKPKDDKHAPLAQLLPEGEVLDPATLGRADTLVPSMSHTRPALGSGPSAASAFGGAASASSGMGGMSSSGPIGRVGTPVGAPLSPFAAASGSVPGNGGTTPVLRSAGGSGNAAGRSVTFTDGVQMGSTPEPQQPAKRGWFGKAKTP